MGTDVNSANSRLPDDFQKLCSRFPPVPDFLKNFGSRFPPDSREGARLLSSRSRRSLSTSGSGWDLASTLQ